VQGRGWIQFNPLFRLPEFMVGVAAWCWVRRFGFPGRLRDWHIDAVLVSGIPVLWLLGKIVIRLGVDPIAVNLGLFDAWFLVLILALAVGRGDVSRILSTPLGQVLGESSYALYILHVPAWYWFATMFDDQQQVTLPVLLAYMVCVVALAIVVWATLERPARRRILGRRRAARVAEWSADSSSR
jgi:peptidoglycan/LPS O-acetylase OafA/YrhL